MKDLFKKKDKKVEEQDNTKLFDFAEGADENEVKDIEKGKYF